MSESGDKIVEWQTPIQEKIDALDPGTKFEFRTLFGDGEWNEITERGRLAASLPHQFAIRLEGHSKASEPIFTGVRSLYDTGESHQGDPKIFQKGTGPNQC